MIDPWIGAAGFFILIALIYIGMHVPVALMLVGVIGITLFTGDPMSAVNVLGITVSEGLSSYVYGVIPLFVLMGYLVNVTDIGKDTFDVANRAIGRIRGGIGIATVSSNAVFAAVTGISVASAAVFAKLATPEMLRLGHSARFSVGVVAGSSVLGMLIPPSLLLVLYGIVAEQSIGDLFVAGVGPGLLLAMAYLLGILLMGRYWKSFMYDKEPEAVAETVEHDGESSWSKLAPVFVLIALVLGGIYGGFFTPTEAGAVGALGALIIGFLKRRLDRTRLWDALVQTGHTTASIGLLLIGATMFAKMLALSQLPTLMGGAIEAADLGIYGTLAIFVVVVLILGTILDAGSIILITLPIMLPAMAVFDTDLIWFGIITIIAVEIGLLTPPLGIACYVIKSALDDDRISLKDVFAGAAPFAGIMLLVLILVVIFPPIAVGLL